MTETPPPDLVGRLRPIPTYRDHPATSPADIAGVDPQGRACTLAILGIDEPMLLLFLSSDCAGCRDLWEGVDGLRRALPQSLRIAVVTRSPDREDPVAVATLSPSGTEVVMSGQAYEDYRVTGPPFLVVVDARQVRTEGVAWGIAETIRATRAALADR